MKWKVLVSPQGTHANLSCEERERSGAEGWVVVGVGGTRAAPSNTGKSVLREVGEGWKWGRVKWEEGCLKQHVQSCLARRDRGGEGRGWKGRGREGFVWSGSYWGCLKQLR